MYLETVKSVVVLSVGMLYLSKRDVLFVPLQAYNAFTEDQRRAIRRHVADIVHAPIDTLEKVGGGGVRCTLAEVF